MKKERLRDYVKRVGLYRVVLTKTPLTEHCSLCQRISVRGYYYEYNTIVNVRFVHHQDTSRDRN